MGLLKDLNDMHEYCKEFGVCSCCKHNDLCDHLTHNMPSKMDLLSINAMYREEHRNNAEGKILDNLNDDLKADKDLIAELVKFEDKLGKIKDLLHENVGLAAFREMVIGILEG